MSEDWESWHYPPEASFTDNFLRSPRISSQEAYRRERAKEHAQKIIREEGRRYQEVARMIREGLLAPPEPAYPKVVERIPGRDITKRMSEDIGQDLAMDIGEDIGEDIATSGKVLDL